MLVQYIHNALAYMYVILTVLVLNSVLSFFIIIYITVINWLLLFGQTFHCSIYDGRNNFKVLKVTEDKGAAIKALTNKLEGYYTCTRFLLERINPNLVESQVPGVDISLILMK